MIEAVIFDFVGVLTQPLAASVASIVAEAGYDAEFVRDVFRPMFASPEDGDQPWHQLERGEVTTEEFLALLGPEREVARALFDPRSPFFALERVAPHEGMLAFAREVRDAGHRTAILSNDAVDWRPAWDALLRTADQFEHVVRSSAIGMRKPDPRIYVHVLDLLDVEAGDALFLDDFEPMVAGARAVGMHAIHVVDHDAAIAEARTMLGLVA